VQKSDLNPKLNDSSVEEKETVIRRLPIDWQGSLSGIPVRYTNQVTVQPVEDQLLLSFFVIVPPMALGTPEEVFEQLSKVESIVPECFSRVLLSQQTTEKLIEILQARLADLKSLGKSNESEL